MSQQPNQYPTPGSYIPRSNYQVHASSNLNPNSHLNPASLPIQTPGKSELIEQEQISTKERVQGQGRPKNLKNLVEGITKVIDIPSKKVEELFENFLKDFQKNGEYIYQEKIKKLPDRQLNTLIVNFRDLINYNEDLAMAIRRVYYRFEPSLQEALLKVALQLIPNYITFDNSGVKRLEKTKILNIAFDNFIELAKIRDLKTEFVGSLVSIEGTVTRTSEVRPELVKAAFRCNACGTIIPEVVQQFKYTEPDMCPNSSTFCNNRREWTLLPHDSQFADWQRVRIQENSHEIPAGSMPRSFDVILRNDMVERAKAGDKAIFTGCLIVVPDVSQLNAPGAKATSQRDTSGRTNEGFGGEGVTGLKSLGVRDLTYKLAFLACFVKSGVNKNGLSTSLEDEKEETQDQFLDSLNDNERAELLELISNPDLLYKRLTNSIAPTIFGHDDLKKGILLQLLGGVHKTTHEGMKLRGDINVCIVGDPSTSKSQFLKFVTGFMPRSIYTSGKASSAAGLTASVVKDDESGDFTIEAGALMLADNGICAIDEFDKMDIRDQVAIHEAMEQQTISIAKAGVHATLNARTAILAAANPIGGRYNNRLTLRQNVAMTPPIMSRFDLFFVVLDRPDPLQDRLLAEHIINVHRASSSEIVGELSTEKLLHFIRFAKTIKPSLTEKSKLLLANYYRVLRVQDSQGVNRNSYRITVRQLESLIRLSEAVARAHASDSVTESHVEEAYRLLRRSIIHIVDDDIDYQIQMQENSNSRSTANTENPTASIDRQRYELIKKLLVMRLEADDAAGNLGLLRSELIAWYLEIYIEQFETPESLEHEAEIVKKVLQFMIHREGILIEVNSGQWKNDTLDDKQENQLNTEPRENDPVILLHPNFSEESAHF